MQQPGTYWVYITANARRGVLYVGVTSKLTGRVWQHRNGALDGFTKRYGCRRLVWFEGFAEPHLAISREKRLKRWRRDWKFTLIERQNPGWRDLWQDLAGPDRVVLTDEMLATLAIPDDPLRGSPG